MGLFGFIKKAVGRVAKAGLSIATHGASDKALKLFKGSAGSKSPRQHEALVAKVTAPAPRTSRTESTVPGWGFARDGYGAERETKRMPGKPKAARRSSGTVGRAYSSTPDDQLMNMLALKNGQPATSEDRVILAELRRRGLMNGAKRTRKPAKARTGARRRPPTGGLDLKALSASWKAAGKPGTWQGWIAANK